MKAIVYQGAKEVGIEQIEKPSVTEGTVLLKNAYAGICGTDLNIFAGTHPRATAPLVLGHEFSATIASEHPIYPIGTRVTVNPLVSCGTCTPCKNGQGHVCNDLTLIGIDYAGGMAEYVTVANDKVIPLPEQLSLQVGALAEPVAVVVHAIRTAKFLPGDEAIVYGAGTIGLCLAIALQQLGAANVYVVETNEQRLKKAESLGFKTIHPATQSVKDMILTATNGDGIDYVFDCAGHPAVLEEITEVVKVQGSIVIVAGYKKPAPLNLLQGMFKELSMQFVRVYTTKDIEIALQLLVKEPKFEQLITHIFTPEQAKEGFDLLTTPSDAIKVLYAFSEEQ
jgi:(R,R)-butanediol dehydrogenase / meso-butanediol dehydrogenase / diacetyl reductase